MPRIERARPLLGTTVAIRLEGLPEPQAHAAIAEAFDAVALVHRLMSFQEPSSEISRLNREAFDRTVDVHPATFEVLHCARQISAASDGIFDVSVAPHLVAAGLLQQPLHIHAPDIAANWRDIQLGDDYRVRFRKPLWVDVSGIAKGYAVDRAIETLQNHGAVQACVNAGGDLRIFGPETERVGMLTGLHEGNAFPVLEIRSAAVASSGISYPPVQEISGRGQVPLPGPHIDPRNGGSVSPDRFVSVIAESCMVADALTKPVLILGDDGAALLSHFGAMAHLHEPRRGWRHLPSVA